MHYRQNSALGENASQIYPHVRKKNVACIPSEGYSSKKNDSQTKQMEMYTERKNRKKRS